MKRLAIWFALAITALPGLAADAAKPNTLTPKEAADGWLLLFDGATTFGWKVDGTAEVKDGALVVGGDKATTITTTTAFPGGNVTLQLVSATPGVSVLIDGRTEALKPTEAPLVVAFTPAKVATPARPIGFAVPAGGKLVVRDVKYRPAELQALFNGTDLAGWKEHPGKKSKFAVVAGVINVKDGPGDLQTEGQWADFLLQLDCISNGKQLNSGIFFRCLPGQYQQGYEAQVHNGWLPAATKEYTLDTYDPESGKVIKSDKVKSNAMDYGTGAIYRRIPARKELAKDGEWFTMTVVAQGPHLATWVNGVQVVDWTDTRPVKDNARAGAKLDKGSISIQGHDPSTDLSFRNFRIVELK